MESLTSITLNLQNPNIATVAYGVQNDRLSRKITAQLVDGSTLWTPPAGALATIRFLKPDGTAGFYDTDEDGNPATVIDGSTVTMTIVEQALTVPGDVYMQLNFYTGDGERLTTFCWLLRVQQNVITDATIISSDYYNILSAQIAAVLEAAASLTGLTASATGLASGESPTVTVTGGSGGTPYNLAFGIPAGPTGPRGVSITETVKKSGTGAPGTTDVYGVELSNGTEAGTFNVYNGADGLGSAGSQTPLAPAAAGVVGVSESFSREDHRHPSIALSAASAFTIPPEGASAAYDMAGLTADHVLIQWGFSASAENSPPAVLTWTTYNGYFTITNSSGTTSETMQPVFAMPSSVAISAH